MFGEGNALLRLRRRVKENETWFEDLCVQDDMWLIFTGLPACNNYVHNIPSTLIGQVGEVQLLRA